MPELPEVETVRLGLASHLEGRTIRSVTLRRKDLRAPFPPKFAAMLEGARVTALRRRAKYILADLEGVDGRQYVWLAHLGMSGSFRTVPKNRAFTPETHDHVILTLDDGMRIIYNDPRRFGQMDAFKKSREAAHPSISKLGPEPLERTFTGPALLANLAGRKTPIKVALLDQAVVAGVGNIYACEALYRAGISPRRAAGKLKDTEAALLARAIKDVMREALASGGSTLRDHRQLDGSTGYFQHAFAVYGHAGQPCGNCTCGGKQDVRSLTQAGRTTFFCPVKQR